MRTFVPALRQVCALYGARVRIGYLRGLREMGNLSAHTCPNHHFIFEKVIVQSKETIQWMSIHDFTGNYLNKLSSCIPGLLALDNFNFKACISNMKFASKIAKTWFLLANITHFILFNSFLTHKFTTVESVNPNSLNQTFKLECISFWNEFKIMWIFWNQTTVVTAYYIFEQVNI